MYVLYRGKDASWGNNKRQTRNATNVTSCHQEQDGVEKSGIKYNAHRIGRAALSFCRRNWCIQLVAGCHHVKMQVEKPLRMKKEKLNGLQNLWEYFSKGRCMCRRCCFAVSSEWGCVMNGFCFPNCLSAARVWFDEVGRVPYDYDSAVWWWNSAFQ